MTERPITDKHVRNGNCEDFIADVVAQIDDVYMVFNQNIDSYGYFCPAKKEICLRPFESYNNPTAYYRVAFHEIAHSLADTKMPYNDEEVVAELCAMLACSHFGMDTRSISYRYAALYLRGMTDKHLIKTLVMKAVERFETMKGLAEEKSARKKIWQC